MSYKKLNNTKIKIAQKIAQKSEWDDLGNHGDLDDLEEEYNDYFPN